MKLTILTGPQGTGKTQMIYKLFGSQKITEIESWRLNKKDFPSIVLDKTDSGKPVTCFVIDGIRAHEIKQAIPYITKVTLEDKVSGRPSYSRIFIEQKLKDVELVLVTQDEVYPGDEYLDGLDGFTHIRLQRA